jgi:hypothetical protein
MPADISSPINSLTSGPPGRAWNQGLPLHVPSRGSLAIREIRFSK